jgi:hypothetical protein
VTIALRVKAKIKEEHHAAVEERHLNLAVCLAKMTREAEVEFICTQAVHLGLLVDSGSADPNPSKRAKVTPVLRTVTKVRTVARSRTASMSLMCSRVHLLAGNLPHKPTPSPATEPSPCPVAGEDDLTPRNSPTWMDWSEGQLDDPLPPLPPAIDFDVSTHSSQASIHAPGNEMVDDSEPSPPPPEDTPQFIVRIRDPESVAPPSLSMSPTPEPKSHLEQVLALIVDRIGAIKTKFGYMQDVIEGRKPHIPKAGVGLTLAPAHSLPPPPCHGSDGMTPDSAVMTTRAGK